MMASNLTFNNLYLFSAKKEAKHIALDTGINVITSSQIDGTDRGKSIILKSLYHALGADARFDDQWDENDKIYILDFSAHELQYFIYRRQSLFKLFNSSKELIFSTIDRSELAEKLKSVFNFAVQLPNRANDRLEITPPAYNYLLNFIDQDHYNGTEFASFKGLGQYSDYKVNTLYYHLGAFDEEYFNLIKEIEKFQELYKQDDSNCLLLNEMLERINRALEGSAYSADLDALSVELDRYKNEYTDLVSRLRKVKHTLVELQNQKIDFAYALSDLKNAENKTDSDINTLNSGSCPYCKSMLTETTLFRAQKLNDREDIILIISDVKKSLLEIDKRIASQTKRYQELLKHLEKYNAQIEVSSAEIDGVLKHKGYIEIRDGLLLDIGEAVHSRSEKEIELKALAKRKRHYEKIKNDINTKYYSLLLRDKTLLGLFDVDEKRFKNISKTFTAGGSNKTIATVMWYVNLLRLKYEFNSGAIRFPVVFDSPNNTETDDEKRHVLLEYLLNCKLPDSQIILSAIGFCPDDFDNPPKINVITLDNEKYHVLCSQDYDQNKNLLLELSAE